MKYVKVKINLSLKHGFKGTRFYAIWGGMKSRCTNPNKDGYERYGGRGIKICKKWNNFINFKNDMYNLYLEHCLEFGIQNTTIDRIDSNKNYCKENCRWATMKEQSRNTSTNRIITYDGKSKTIVEWAEYLDYKRSYTFCP